ncbi:MULTISPECIES: hypothetical protein [Fusobacterium]|uniref:TIGR03545 family protein n=1 Tax=Fusobacterium mortiferum ATCC 9817 TaxID=469616 RepID=A0ABN5JBL8_FUSMR|nr:MULTISPECIES: hypothetical protein [Fusobacterium]AVQ19872.1 hypothetical protein C4N19_12535 [Fusobacterium mortiferum ATCC 9817]EEO35692.1 TIGR03545 family protein [Fusobacterium mortiferum ATCC 9817]MSS61208.1 hypothetical protein [Fusobacterium sp. FSA-380-WT-2B]
MKKKIGIAVGILVVLLGGVYFSKDYIIKKVLENKLTEINKGKVDIGSVDFSPFSKKIVIEDIDITSRKDGMKNFISIGKFETDYDIYFKDKKVLVSRADFSDVKFMTPRDSDGSTGYVVEEKNDVVIDKTGVEEKKNDGVQDLEELIRARAMVNKMTLQNMLQLQYEEIEGKLKEKREYWNGKIEELEKTPEYMILKQNYEKISQEKNPLKIIRMEKEIKNMVAAFKTLSKEFLSDRKAMKEDFKSVLSVNDMDKKLETTVNELVGRGEFVINDLDSIINYYLNEIYGEKIKDMVVKYRNVMREVELRKDEDAKLQDKWEVFAEEITVNSKIYGIELKGGIKNISSRLSRNKTNIGIYLTADSDISHGEAYGYIDLNKIQGKINVKIPNFNFKDLEDMEALHKYVEEGEASLDKEVLLSRDNIDIIGDVEIQDMSLNSDEITGKLNIDSPLLKAMINPLLKDLRSGNVKYSYNSLDEKLVVESDLSQEIMNILNDKDGSVKKKIVEDMIKEGKEEIKNYRDTLDKDNQNSLEELEEKLNEKSKYLDKVQEILDKFNIGGILDNI